MANLFLAEALSIPWAITPEGLSALVQVYEYAREMKGSVTDRDFLKAMEDNEDLGHALHKGTADAEYSISKGMKVEGVKYGALHTNGVAVMSLNGPIFPRASLMTEYSGAVSISQFTSDFVRLYNNQDVRGIVLDVDSPGGAVTKIGDSAKIINMLSKLGRKPVAAFATGYMASAAYYIGSAVGKGNIYASEMSGVGSIGVLLTIAKDSGGYIEIVSEKSPNKRPDVNTEEGRAIYQSRVNDLYDIFEKDVAYFREVTPEKVSSNFGKGDVYAGARAKSVGLVDKVSTIGDVVNMVARKAATATTGKGSRSYASATAQGLLEYTDEDINSMGLKDMLGEMFAPASAAGETDDSVASGQSDNPDASDGSVEQTIIVQSLTDKTREQLEEEFAPMAKLTAKNLVLESKILPSERAQVICDIVNAKADDTMFGGTDVSFVNAEGQIVEGTREQAALARYETRASHDMTKPAIAGVSTDGKRNLKATILDDAEEDTSADANKEDLPLTPERKKELLAASAAGRSVLQGQASSN